MQMCENTTAPNYHGNILYKCDIDDAGFSEDENCKMSTSELWWLNLTSRKIIFYTSRVQWYSQFFLQNIGFKTNKLTS